MIYALLTLSVSLNVLMIWYSVKLLETVKYIQDNSEVIQTIGEDFKEHLEAVNQLEMYYGDSTLSELLKHAKHVSEQMSIYSNAMDMTGTNEVEEEREE